MDNYTLNENEINILIKQIIKNVKPAEILEKINPKLKTVYEDRLYHYKDDNADNILKIPKFKMNEEERFLLACLHPENIKQDLNSLLDYLEKIYEAIKMVNQEGDENFIIQYSMEKGLNHFYSSKIKLYIPDDEDEVDLPIQTKKLTEEEIKKELEEFDKHPLFMQNIPQNIEDNPQLEALQALKFEGSPETIATEFFTKSKESFDKFNKSKKFEYLKETMYNICTAIDHVSEDSTVSDNLKFELYLFRANLQILVKNLGHAINDLKNALFYNDNDQAYLLLIDCYISLESFDKAKSLLNERRIRKKELLQTENIILYDKKEELIKGLKLELLSKLEKIQIFKNLENNDKLRLYENLSKKGIKMKQQYHNIPANYQASIYQDEGKIYHFPILILYEEFNLTDYIQDVEENSLISDILDVLFQEKLPWDRDNKYNLNTIICYYEITEFDANSKKEINYYYPLRNDDRLIEVLTNKKVHMNGFPVLVIISQISSYYNHFLKNKTVLKRR